MAPVLVLHVGPHKTGTTAIQAALDAGRAELAAQGWNYVACGRPEHGPSEAQHRLAWAMRGLHGVSSLDEWDELSAEIAASPSKQHLASAEAFAGASTMQIRRAIERLPNVDVRAVLYVRDRIDLLRSQHGQWIRFEGDHRSFAEFAEDRRSDADFDSMLASWRAVLGRDAVVVRSYDRAVSAGSVVDDLLGVLGVHLDHTDGRANESPGAGALAERLVSNLSESRPWVRHVPGVRHWARRRVVGTRRQAAALRRRHEAQGWTPVDELVDRSPGRMAPRAMRCERSEG